MALWDHAIASGHKELVQKRARKEECQARAQFGFLPQTDWWAIQRACFGGSFTQLTNAGGLVRYLGTASADARYVAMLVAPLANLQRTDIKDIATAPMDRSSYLTLYVYALAEILERHYASTSRVPFVTQGAANWDGLPYPQDDIAHFAEMATGAEQRFTFQCGRKQMLYERLEADLDSNAWKPDWFLPSEAFAAVPWGGAGLQSHFL